MRGAANRISIEEAFLWTQRFAAREWRLLLPVALAFMALPPLLLGLLLPDRLKAMIAQSGAGAGPVDSAMLGGLMPFVLAVLTLSCLGGLALTALALVPRISVREALVLAARRLWVLLAALVLVGVGLLVALTFVSIVLSLARVNVAAQQGLLVGVILGAVLLLWVRLALLAPLIVERRVGPIAALRAAWAISRGGSWRLLGALAVYLVGGGVVLLALGSALRVLLLVLGRSLGLPELGSVLADVLVQAVAAAVNVGLQLLVVALYRQLVGSSRGS